LKEVLNKELGPAFLFYGVRTRNDIYYKDLLFESLNNHYITHLYIAFSNESNDDNLPGMFVSDKIIMEKEKLFDYLIDFNYYLCGGVKGYAKSCYKAIEFVYNSKYNKNGEEFIKELKKNNQVFEDLADS
jgi:sulfite reductase alpha subunit-like flavoprotein